MSSLRDAALAAAEAERADREREAAELARLDAEHAISLVAKSPLGEWFPDVTWEYMREIDVHIKLVREAGEESPIFGVQVIDRGDQGPDDYSIYIVRLALTLGAIFGQGPRWEIVAQPTSAGDVGRYIEATTPKTKEETEAAIKKGIVAACPGDPSHSIRAHAPGGIFFGVDEMHGKEAE